MTTQLYFEGDPDLTTDPASSLTSGEFDATHRIIHKTFPNPFSNQLVIKYGVFKKSKVSLLVFDMAGKMVATLEERTLTPEKHEAVWQPDNSLPDGHYFIALKINDLQVHYLKVIRHK